MSPRSRRTRTDYVEFTKSRPSVHESLFDEMQEMFAIFDSDGSGAIDPKEIKSQMNALGFEVDNNTIYQLISDLDSDGSQKLEFEEFFGLMTDQLSAHKPEFYSKANMFEVFDYFDDLDQRNRDGKIDIKNLRRLATVLGDDITDKEIEVMVRGADRDGRGFVTPDDFYALMCNTSSLRDRGQTHVPLRMPSAAGSEMSSLGVPKSPKSGPRASFADFGDRQVSIDADSPEAREPVAKGHRSRRQSRNSGSQDVEAGEASESTSSRKKLHRVKTRKASAIHS